MTDDDTTPTALRKWLLRSSDNTTRLKSTTKSALLRRLVAFICAAGLAWHLCTFENAADLRFFGGIGVALDLWLATHAANATVLELPCDQISRVYDAQQPIIFRSCIPEGVGLRAQNQSRARASTREKQSKPRCKLKLQIGGRIDRVSKARYLDWWF